MATQGNDVLDGTPNIDAIDGLDGTDQIDGMGSADTLSGGGGADTIFGGDGNDIIYGFGSADVDPNSGLIAATRVASGFSNPVFGVSAPGDPNRMFVVEQHTGDIHILNLTNNTVDPDAFLDLPPGTLAGGNEQGLLGLAFHPSYATNGKFYVYLTDASGDIEVREYTRSEADHDVADVGSMRTILTYDHPQSNHNGGWMAFGPDGKLYIASGDGGGSGDPTNQAQNLNSLLGKILRIDVNGDDFPTDANANYAIPSDNPFVGEGRGEIWHYGLRNPWRPAFDPATGDLYIADVGQSTKEELSFAAAGTSGLNFGWKVMEGTHIFNNSTAGNPHPGDPILVAPLLDYPHAAAPDGGIAITGGYVYHAAGGAQGVYFFADYGTGQLWTTHVVNGVAVDFVNRTTQLQLDAGDFNSIASFAVDGTGRLYAIELDGEIHRLTPSAAAANSNDVLHGGNGNDTIRGGWGADQLFGDNNDDQLFGGLGDDVLNGGNGIDTMQGDAGSDTYYVNSAADQVVETSGQGADTVIAAASYGLTAGSSVELLRTYGSSTTTVIDLIGSNAANTLQGNAAANKLNGSGGGDVMYGYAGNDIFYVDNAADRPIESTGQGSDRVIANVSYVLQAGTNVELLRTYGSATTADIDLTANNLDNLIQGNSGDNTLNGGPGKDFLETFGGDDVLVFNTALGVANIDTIADFDVSHDMIHLDDAIFSAIGTTLTANEFRVAASAGDADDRIVYEAGTGILRYDPDGTGAASAVQFAKLTAGLGLSAGDFQIV